MNVLVTGTSRGIGRAIALALAARGGRLALHYHLDRAAAEETRRLMVGRDHVVLGADLADARAVEHLWHEAARALGRIDVLVNNAGINEKHSPLTASFAALQAAWERLVAVNLLGAAHLSFFAGQAMAAQSSGRIVNLSSRGAFRGEPDAPAYGATKAGVNAFSQSLAKALAPKNVCVFVVAPGWVATERVAGTTRDAAVLALQPLGRVATPEEVAQVVAFCAWDAPASMTGAVLDVNGASYLRT